MSVPYTIRTMPDSVFDNWLEYLRSGNYKQIALELHRASNEYCAWGVYLRSTYGPETEYKYELLEGIDDKLFKYVTYLNDSEGLSFTEIAARLSTNRKRAVGVYKVKQNISRYLQ